MALTFEQVPEELLVPRVAWQTGVVFVAAFSPDTPELLPDVTTSYR